MSLRDQPTAATAWARASIVGVSDLGRVTSRATTRNGIRRLQPLHPEVLLAKDRTLLASSCRSCLRPVIGSRDSSRCTSSGSRTGVAKRHRCALTMIELLTTHMQRTQSLRVPGVLHTRRLFVTCEVRLTTR